MTLQEFIDKYKGKKLDFDNYADGQCFDLFRGYVQEVLNFPQSGATGDKGAAILWEEFDKDPVLVSHYDKIPNSDTFIPNSGDVAVWNRRMGSGYGHVAICTGKGDLKTFESFDQNWSKISYCELVIHPYTSFYGVLRPKSFNEPDPEVEELEKELVYKNEQIANYSTQVTGLVKKVEEITQQLSTSNDASNGFRKELNDFIAELASIYDTRQEKSEILAEARASIEFEDKALKLDRLITAERASHAEAITTLEKRIAGLERDLTSIKDELKSVKQSTPQISIAKTSLFAVIIKKVLSFLKG